MKACVVDPRHTLDEKTFRKQGATIFRCGDCGCIMADIAFQHEQYESSSYYTLSRKTLDDIDKEWGFRWRYILNKIVRRESPSSLLDVGAGNGYFVSLAANEFGVDASGIEISAEEIRFAKNVICVDLVNEDIAQHSRAYDIVTCFNVIEHVPDPRSFLASVIARVKPGGILALTTPNPRCIHARIKGIENWNMVDPPHHINLFSRRSLHALLSEKNMQVTGYETLSTYVNFVRKFDTDGLLLRRLFFYLLRMANLGADHFVVSKKLHA